MDNLFVVKMTISHLWFSEIVCYFRQPACHYHNKYACNYYFQKFM